MRRRLADSHKGGLDEERRHDRIEVVLGKRRIVLQDAKRSLVQMRGAGGGPEKVKRNT